jgi:hypothetical protein
MKLVATRYQPPLIDTMLKNVISNVAQLKFKTSFEILLRAASPRTVAARYKTNEKWTVSLQ